MEPIRSAEHVPGRNKDKGCEASLLGKLADSFLVNNLPCERSACPWAEGCVGENVKLKAEPVFGSFILTIRVTEGECPG